MEDSIRLLIRWKKQGERWRLAWVWTFGALLVAVVAILGLVAGKL